MSVFCPLIATGLTCDGKCLRNNYAAARLQGLQDDLGLSDTDYQIGLSTLFIGYVLMQVPSNALLNYVGRPSIYIGFFVRSTLLL